MCWHFRAGESGWHRVHDLYPGLDLIFPITISGRGVDISPLPSLMIFVDSMMAFPMSTVPFCFIIFFTWWVFVEPGVDAYRVYQCNT